jgi:hypothetical protein
MAEINVASKLSFGEIAKRTDPKGGLLEIFEAMNEQNPQLSRIPAVPCNQRYSHKINRRTSLPTGTWRKAYQGVASKASTTQAVTFNTALLEALSEVDATIVDTSEDPKGTRRQEDLAFVEGMSEQVWTALIEGTMTSAPEQFDGLQQYLNSLSHTMVFDGGNAGGTSIYAADFSPQTCYFIYPSGVTDRGTLGLKIDTAPDGGNGKVWRLDDNSNNYLVYRTQFQWWLGFVVRDELAIGRYANINPTVGGSNTFDENKIIEMLTYGRFGRGTTLLCTKEIMAQMRIRLKDKSNVNFDVARGLDGAQVLGFQGNGYFAPIYRCDAISTSETTVS